MNLASAVRSALRKLPPFDAEKRHHGLQLAAAVVIAYFASAILGLPEHLWAVMTALIVLRPSSGGTWDAGWDRARGTLIGALGGLLGVFLEHHGAPPLATLLATVAVLSFASAASPALRSAPVAALIILGAGDIAGHSALQVAVVRVLQILLGVGVAMAVALASSRYRASTRFKTGSASLLQRLARQVRLAAVHAAPAEAEVEKAGAALRHALDRLSVLAAGADRETRLFRTTGAPNDPRFHRRVAGLTARIVQDAAMLSRVLRVVGVPSTSRLSHEAAEAAGTALASLGEWLAGRGQPALGALAQLNNTGHADAPPDALLAAPLHLLLGDLQHLAALIGKSRVDA